MNRIYFACISSIVVILVSLRNLLYAMLLIRLDASAKNLKKLLQQQLSSDLSGTEVDSSKTSTNDDDLDKLIKAREKAAEQN